MDGERLEQIHHQEAGLAPGSAGGGVGEAEPEGHCEVQTVSKASASSTVGSWWPVCFLNDMKNEVVSYSTAAQWPTWLTCRQPRKPSEDLSARLSSFQPCLPSILSFSDAYV